MTALPRRLLRFADEWVLLGVLAGSLFVAVVVVVQQLVGDEKMQYLLIGYYAAIHHDLVRWVWKRLRVDKADPA